jgi:signal transduction histidine kinase
VEGHQGILDFESEVGRGTTFILKLPLLTRHGPEPAGPIHPETIQP